MGHTVCMTESPKTQIPKSELEYSLPQPRPTGILRIFPESCRPYAELARLDKPAFSLLWMVYCFGLFPASILKKLPLQDTLTLAALALVPCQVLRWFNFVWNDICDVEIDRQVVRTRHRPLARNALSRREALVFNGLLGALLLWFIHLGPPSFAIYSVPLACGCLVYPFWKRFSNYPQLFFGFLAAGNVFMGAAAAGIDGLPYPTRVVDIFSPKMWWSPPQNAVLVLGSQYLMTAVWLISAETVYSYQDAECDEVVGVGTITRLIADPMWGKRLLILLASLQLSLFGLTGVLLGFHATLWAFSLCLTAAAIATLIVRVDLKRPESCMFWFRFGTVATGSAMLFGYGTQYFLRTRDW